VEQRRGVQVAPRAGSPQALFFEQLQVHGAQITLTLERSHALDDLVDEGVPVSPTEDDGTSDEDGADDGGAAVVRAGRPHTTMGEVLLNMLSMALGNVHAAPLRLDGRWARYGHADRRTLTRTPARRAAALALTRLSTDTELLPETLGRLYLSQLLLRSYHVLGAADALGGPGTLLRGVADGVRTLVTGTAHGLVEGERADASLRLPRRVDPYDPPFPFVPQARARWPRAWCWGRAQWRAAWAAACWRRQHRLLARWAKGSPKRRWTASTKSSAWVKTEGHIPKEPLC
jgi:hypothetical protein